jgi:hypothetical protein
MTKTQPFLTFEIRISNLFRASCFEIHASRARWLLIAVVTLQFVGCTSSDKWKDGRPKTYFTSGKVLLNGQPEEGVTVTFQPVDAEKGKPGWAITDANGYFEAQTFDPRDGLTEGTHRVALKKAQLVDRATGKVVTEVTTDAPLKELHVVPEKYNDFSASQIEIQIAAKKNRLEPFQLTK